MQQYTSPGLVDSRPSFVFTPQTSSVGSPVPLLVMLHGCGQTATDFAVGTAMNVLAEAYSFIVVYPQQTNRYNLHSCWNWFDPAHQVRECGEPASIAGIVQSMQQDTVHWTIDPRRIYVAGLSAGAAMAVVLGTTYPDLFAAVGVHSGLEYQAATTLERALKAMRRGGPDPFQQGNVAYAAMKHFARVVPLIVFHGTHDTTVTPINGDQTVQQWMYTDQLAAHGSYTSDFHHPDTVQEEQHPGMLSASVFTWKGDGGRDVQSYWKVNGLGHAWSGGSPGGSFTNPRGPNASREMVRFFLDHPMEGVERHPFSAWKSLRRLMTEVLHVKRADRLPGGAYR